MSKYEQLIEFIINEQEDKARELFHQIVVEKSREIYESLVDSEDLDEVGGNQVQRFADEVEGDEMQEGEDEFGGEGDEELGGDIALDGEEEFGGEEEMGGEEGLEDRVMDLESALDELKAEFDALMADEENEPEHHDGIEDPDFGGEEEAGEEEVMYEDSEEAEEEDEEEDLEESKQGRKMTEAEWIREYVEKIGEPYSQQPAQGEGHEVGTGKKASVDSKSIVAGKNDMGGTASNIAKGGTEVDPDGKQIAQPSNEYSKGKGQLKGAGKFQNVPGGNAGKSSFKTKEGEYSKEKGKEGQTTGGKVAVSAKSPLAK